MSFNRTEANCAVVRDYADDFHGVLASVAEYEQWANTVDAATTSVPVDVGVAIARELTQELFEA